MKKVIAKVSRHLLYIVLSPIAIIYLLSIISRARRLKRNFNKPKFVFGSTPIISFSSWSNLLAKSGFSTTSFVTEVYSINHYSDWDVVIKRSDHEFINMVKTLRHFAKCLLQFDIFVMSCDGFLIGKTKFWRLQSLLLNLSGCKSIVFPYGGDSYVYSNVRSPLTLQGLMLSYPEAARNQDKLSKQLEYWVKHADVFIPGSMGLDGFGRWDFPSPSPFQIDLDVWSSTSRNNNADGKTGEVVIAHAPNHRGFKGTEIITKIIGELQKEGLKIRFLQLEKLKNSEVREILASKVDILIEQILFSGYALNAIEGMASGIPVLSNLESKEHLEHLRIWSFLDQCPIVSADNSNLKAQLRKLVENPELRKSVGEESRRYVESFHGIAACNFMFKSILAKLEDSSFDLQRIYESRI